MKKKLTISFFILCLLVAVYFVWNNVYIYFNSKFLLEKTYYKYASLFDVKACREAYDFLSTESKKNHTYEEFKNRCDSPNSLSIYTKNTKLQEVVLLSRNFAKLQIGRTITNNQETNYLTNTMTWVLENGRWKRQWPD